MRMYLSVTADVDSPVVAKLVTMITTRTRMSARGCVD